MLRGLDTVCSLLTNLPRIDRLSLDRDQAVIDSYVISSDEPIESTAPTISFGVQRGGDQQTQPQFAPDQTAPAPLGLAYSRLGECNGQTGNACAECEVA